MYCKTALILLAIAFLLSIGGVMSEVPVISYIGLGLVAIAFLVFIAGVVQDKD